jgi:hypothetical protein
VILIETKFMNYKYAGVGRAVAAGSELGDIHQLVLGSHFPHKIVHLLFNITYQNIKLTNLWGS